MLMLKINILRVKFSPIEITNLIYSTACNFYLWCPLFVEIITQNVIIFIVADIYEREPTFAEFLNLHLKNSVL